LFSGFDSSRGGSIDWARPALRAAPPIAPCMITERVGAAFVRPLDALVRLCAHVSPDVLTITGLALNGVACALFALAGGRDYTNPGLLRLGGLVALAASIFDMMDGRV